jgi:REP element-mobilizing transposase RayT
MLRGIIDPIFVKLPASVLFRPKSDDALAMSGDRYLITDQNGLYFLTFTVVQWIDVFTRPEYKKEIVDSLKFCQKEKGLIIYAWCLMTNHLHIICRAKEGKKISDIIRDFKKFTAKRMLSLIEGNRESRKDWMLYRFEYAGKYDKRITKYKFWKESNHAVYLETNEMMQQRLDYTHENPVKAMIVENPEDYLFSSARNYAGLEGLIDVEYIE